MKTEKANPEHVDRPPSGEGGPVPAVTRASGILDELARAQSQPLSVSELSRRLNLPKSSTANLCIALEAEGLLRRLDTGFLLGRRLVELGGAYLAGVDQITEFYAVCRKQPCLSKQTARVAVLDGMDVLYLARYDGVQPIRLTASIGDRFPAHCTATGKILLAQLSQPVVAERYRGQRQLVGLTDRSVTDPVELFADLDRARERGYAIDDEETTLGVTCLAVAVPGFRTDNEPFGVSATVVKSQLTETLRASLLDDLRAVCAAMRNPLLPDLAAAD